MDFGASHLILEGNLRHSRNAYTTAHASWPALTHRAAVARKCSTAKCSSGNFSQQPLLVYAHKPRVNALGAISKGGQSQCHTAAVPARSVCMEWSRSGSRKITRAVNSLAVFPFRAVSKSQKGVVFRTTTWELKDACTWHSRCVMALPISTTAMTQRSSQLNESCC